MGSESCLGFNSMHLMSMLWFDVFLRLWVLRETPLVASGVLRSTLDPFGSLPVKTPP